MKLSNKVEKNISYEPSIRFMGYQKQYRHRSYATKRDVCSGHVLNWLIKHTVQPDSFSTDDAFRQVEGVSCKKN